MILLDQFRHQATSCAALDSPFMARLLTLLVDHCPMDTAIARKFASFGDHIGPAGHSLPLRIAGGLHALVLTQRDAVLAALVTHSDFLLD